MTKRRLVVWISLICLLAVLIPCTALAATDGWNQNADGTWSYYIRGDWYRNGVYDIRGKNYGFDSNGIMLTNKWFERYDDVWYYFTADGSGAEDFLKIGGTWYFFEDGRMVTDALVLSKDGSYYYIYKSGAAYVRLPAKGWFQINGTYYYHNGGGQLVKNQVISDGGQYYGFDEDGRMYECESFAIETRSYYGGWRTQYYRAKAGGALYVNAWYQDAEGDWYYYGTGGVAANDDTQVGGVQYYFDYNGRMFAQEFAYIDGGSYAFDANGKKITAQGKYDLGEYYVYVKADGTLAECEWISIGGKWYYFEPEMVANTLRRIDGVLYAADNAGVCTAVTANGFYDAGLSGLMYIENGKPVEGWKHIGGSWYYFSPGMYADAVRMIDGTYYVFDRNGKMFTGGWLLLGDIYSKGFDNQEHWYAYADASGKAATGLKTIGGKQYLFSQWGYLYTDTSVKVNGTTYVVDKSGRVISDTGTDGWKQVDDKYYYVSGGRLVKNEILEIGNKRYAFDYYGVMYADGVYWVNYETGVLAGPDGALKEDGWYQHRGQWYYADRFGRLQTGQEIIDDKTYIFMDYRLMIGTFWYGEQIVTTDASGEVISRKNPADGWDYVDGVVYYHKNGLPYTGWVGDYLILDGQMVIADYVQWKGVYYAFDNYGRYVKSGWHRFDYGDGVYSDYVYAKPGGKLCYNEWLALNGKWYYFDGVYMLSSGNYYVDGQLCRFDANGVYLGAATASADGWKQVGSDWYYLHAGEPVTGIQQVGGKRYVFDAQGVMITDEFLFVEDEWSISGLWYYADSNGTIPNYTGWKLIDGKWVYFDKNNLPVIGWFQDGGKEYYCEVKWDDGEISVGMVTGYLYSNGQLYYFNSSGACQGTKGVENGWYQAGGDWYYFRNGAPVTGYQVIGGKGYYFCDGVMVADEIIDGRYFTASGAQRSTKGWYETSMGWIWVKADGTLVDGVQIINGKEYYFRNYVMIR